MANNNRHGMGGKEGGKVRHSTALLLPSTFIEPQKPPVPLEKLVGYRARGFSYREIAKMCNLREQTVWERLNRYNGTLVEGKHFVAKEADILDGVRALLIGAMKDVKLGDTPLREIAQAYSVLFDKAQLLKGKATNKTEVEHGVSPEIKEMMDSILGRKEETPLPQAQIVGDVESDEVEEEESGFDLDELMEKAG